MTTAEAIVTCVGMICTFGMLTAILYFATKN